ncbi:FAD-binding oxidoreductase [Chloroflexi bacterium]|nr:FAD-binding oxidoreductase [Chloroflexota bacterium]
MNPDVIVIGGGIAGCSAALHLSESGISTLLLDRGEISGEASGVNMGGLGGVGWGRFPGLQEYLTMGSLNIFKRLQMELGYDLEFRQSGSFTAIHNEKQYSYAKNMVIESQKNAFNLQLLSPYEAKSIEPELNLDMLGYVYSPTRGQADPLKTTRAFGRAALHAGAKVQTNTEVIGMTSDQGIWVVETNEGNYEAQSVVIAAGAWSKKIGKMVGINIPIEPIVGQMWSTEPLPPRVFSTISSFESSFHWSENLYVDDASPPELTHFEESRVTRHLYGRQRRSGEIIFGGDRRSSGFNKTMDATGIEVNKEHATEVLPLLSSLPISTTWSGLMPFSADGKPVIGRIPENDRLFVVSGLGSSGFGRGPGAGMLIADLVSRGESHPVLLESDPARFAS